MGSLIWTLVLPCTVCTFYLRSLFLFSRAGYLVLQEMRSIICICFDKWFLLWNVVRLWMYVRTVEPINTQPHTKSQLRWNLLVKLQNEWFCELACVYDWRDSLDIKSIRLHTLELNAAIMPLFDQQWSNTLDIILSPQSTNQLLHFLTTGKVGLMKRAFYWWPSVYSAHCMWRAYITCIKNESKGSLNVPMNII